MKKVLSLAVGVVLLATAPVMAEGLKISGFVDIVTPLMLDTGDPALSGLEADFELQTGADAEVDFEKTVGKVTVRLDVDSTDGAVAIEQAKFIVNNGSWWFTGGSFNSPIGFELQDAPDMLQITHGQLFDRKPANLTGYMVGGSWNKLTVNGIFANDVNGDPRVGETDNSLGLSASLALGEKSNLALGLITSESATSGDLVSVVATTKVIPNLLLAFEYQTEDTYKGWGLTGNYKHGVHGITLRYDLVDTEGSADDAATSLTLAAKCEMTENVASVIEWRTNDSGAVGADNTSSLNLKFVGKF